MIIICCTEEHGGSDHYWPTREMLFEWCFAGGPIMAHFIIFTGNAKTSLRICVDP